MLAIYLDLHAVSNTALLPVAGKTVAEADLLTGESRAPAEVAYLN